MRSQRCQVVREGAVPLNDTRDDGYDECKCALGRFWEKVNPSFRPIGPLFGRRESQRSREPRSGGGAHARASARVLASECH